MGATDTDAPALLGDYKQTQKMQGCWQQGFTVKTQRCMLIFVIVFMVMCLSELGALGWMFNTKFDATKSSAYHKLENVVQNEEKTISMLKEDLDADEEELKMAYTPERIAYDKAGKVVAEAFDAFVQSESVGAGTSVMQSVFSESLKEMKKTDKQMQATDRFVVAESKQATGVRARTHKYLVFKYKGPKGEDKSYPLSLGDGLYSLVLKKYLEAKLKPAL